MKGEEQIINLLMEVLQKQDEAKQDMQTVKQEVQTVKQEVQTLKQTVTRMDERLVRVEENQQIHQTILRTLATKQDNHQQALEQLFVLLDSVTRMQRDHGRRLDRLENPGGPGRAA